MSWVLIGTDFRKEKRGCEGWVLVGRCSRRP